MTVLQWLQCIHELVVYFGRIRKHYKKAKRMVKDIKVIPSEDLDSDHQLLVMNMSIAENQDRNIRVLKLKKTKIKGRRMETVQKLYCGSGSKSMW